MELHIDNASMSIEKGMSCHTCRYYLEEKLFCAYYGISSKPVHICEKWH